MLKLTGERLRDSRINITPIDKRSRFDPQFKIERDLSQQLLKDVKVEECGREILLGYIRYRGSSRWVAEVKQGNGHKERRY